jgi:Fic family protein
MPSNEAEQLHDEFVSHVRARGIDDIAGLLRDRLPAGVTPLEQLHSLHTLHGWLRSFRPFPAAVVQELKQLYTVRLTYHSNAIEGNTLTQSETEMVLSHGVTVGGKTLVEHLEVTGHRDAMAYMEELATSTTPIGEWQIRELHSLIMQPIDQVTGATEAGRYRTLDVRAAGTEHVYPPHYRVPELMHAMANWLVSEQAQSLHPVEHAAAAHYRLASIHPFRDGNGRTARLLMNLLLLRAGYPIAIITNERRVQYIDALIHGQSHDDDIGPLLSLIAAACRESCIETLATLATAADSRGQGEHFYRDVLSGLRTED